jgi:pyrroloquinoline quinone biosynthesis protein E
MREPCRSCARKEIDWGGCRCQAFAFAGSAEATDPACSRSPLHAELVRLASVEAAAAPPAFVYRRPNNSAAARAGRALADASPEW